MLYFAAKNRTLTHLDLSWNNIQLKGSVALLTRMEASVLKLIAVKCIFILRIKRI